MWTRELLGTDVYHIVSAFIIYSMLGWLVESIYIDWNYDGETLRPTVCDVPGKDELVSGAYEIPASATRIKIKITDLLSESLELEV